MHTRKAGVAPALSMLRESDQLAVWSHHNVRIISVVRGACRHRQRRVVGVDAAVHMEDSVRRVAVAGGQINAQPAEVGDVAEPITSRYAVAAERAKAFAA